MRNKFLVFGFFCMMVVNLQAQSDSLLQNSDIRRYNFRLVVDYSNGRSFYLEKNQLQKILSDEEFRSYKHARRCYVASASMLSSGTVFIIFGMVMAKNIGFDVGRAYLAGSSILTGITFFIPGITLISYSAIKLNRTA